MNLEVLEPDVDYLFCPDCGHHIAATRLGAGLWQFDCSRCMGECGLCECGLAKRCFGQAEVTMSGRTVVIKAIGHCPAQD